jgi:hypothetical protein
VLLLLKHQLFKDLNNNYFRSEGALKNSSTAVPNSRGFKLDSKADPLESLDLYNSSRSPPARNPRSTSLDRLNNLPSAYNQVMSKDLNSTAGTSNRLSK